MTTRYATDAELANWDEHIQANPDGGNVFQGVLFAKQKQLTGWTPRYIVAGDAAVTVHEKKVPFLGKLWYVPKGPGVVSARELAPVLAKLHELAQKNGVFAIKIEPELRQEKETVADLLKLYLQKVPAIQPNFSTVLLDLSPSLDDIMAGLNQKGRHAIRRAERDGVTVERVEATDEHCQRFYTLLAETAAGSFRIRHYDYYKAFWQRYAAAGAGQLFFAYVDGSVVAGAFAVVYGGKSTYKDGASIRERTVYGASHLLQWEVITWAKEQGSALHDLCGAPPSDQIKNEQHPHYGIGRFKTSFNKEVVDYVGAWDLPISALRYKLWRKFGERIVLSWHNRRHKESWY